MITDKSYIDANPICQGYGYIDADFFLNYLKMKKIFKASVLLIFLFLGISYYSFGQATDLIISEYGEGTSGNSKYIEIYNGTGSSVDISNYDIWIVSNGGTWPEATISLTGTLTDGSTYVIANNVTDVPGADKYSGSCSWNGDDAVGLAKSSALIDVIGEDGADPGTGWDVAGTVNATANHKLTRKSSICSPNTDWDSSRGTNTTNSEWIVGTYITGAATSGHTASCSCTAPTTQASNITFSAVDITSMNVSWTGGDGSGRIVIINTSNSFTNPVDGVDPVANSTYGGAGEQVVYNGSLNTVSVDGLTPGTTYWFRVYEYNCSGASIVFYNVTASNNPNSQATLSCVTPTTQASSITFSSVGSSSMNVSWTDGDGSNRIVIINTSNSFTNPVDGTDPAASSVYGGAGEQVVFNGSGNNVTVIGLTASTTYWFRVYEYNCTGTNTVGDFY